jgi:ribose transport system substrate-binding protein
MRDSRSTTTGSTMLMRHRSRLILTATAGGALLALTACGGGSDSAAAPVQSDAASSSAAAPAADPKEAAKAILAKATDQATLEWVKPTVAFKPGKHKLAIVASGLTGGNIRAADQMKAAATAMGWTATIFDGKLDPTVQASVVQQAVVQKYDAIILSSIDTQTISAGVDAAAAAKIPVVCNECLPREGTVKVVTYDWEGSGRNMGAYIVSQDGCKASIASFPDKAFPTVSLYITGLTKQVNELCPNVKIDQTFFPTSDLAKPGPPTWTAYLAAHPKGSFNWAATAYENQAVAFAQTLADQGREGIRITSLQSSLPETIKDISSGSSPFEATIFPPADYEGWASVDTAARLVVGAPTWGADKLPTLLVTKDNIAGIGKATQLMPNFDFKALFQQMWAGQT